MEESEAEARFMQELLAMENDENDGDALHKNLNQAWAEHVSEVPTAPDVREVATATTLDSGLSQQQDEEARLEQEKIDRAWADFAKREAQQLAQDAHGTGQAVAKRSEHVAAIPRRCLLDGSEAKPGAQATVTSEMNEEAAKNMADEMDKMDDFSLRLEEDDSDDQEHLGVSCQVGGYSPP